MTRKEKWLIRFIFFLFGMVAGYLLAPAKNGLTLSCGNNSGNNNTGSLSMKVCRKKEHGQGQ